MPLIGSSQPMTQLPLRRQPEEIGRAWIRTQATCIWSFEFGSSSKPYDVLMDIQDLGLFYQNFERRATISCNILGVNFTLLLNFDLKLEAKMCQQSKIYTKSLMRLPPQQGCIRLFSFYYNTLVFQPLIRPGSLAILTPRAFQFIFYVISQLTNTSNCQREINRLSYEGTLLTNKPPLGPIYYNFSLESCTFEK